MLLFLIYAIGTCCKKNKNNFRTTWSYIQNVRNSVKTPVIYRNKLNRHKAHNAAARHYDYMAASCGHHHWSQHVLYIQTGTNEYSHIPYTSFHILFFTRSPSRRLASSLSSSRLLSRTFCCVPYRVRYSIKCAKLPRSVALSASLSCTHTHPERWLIEKRAAINNENDCKAL